MPRSVAAATSGQTGAAWEPRPGACSAPARPSWHNRARYLRAPERRPGSADWRSLTLAAEGGPGGGDSAGRVAAAYCGAAERRRRTPAPPPLPLSGCQGDNRTPRGGGGDKLRSARLRPSGARAQARSSGQARTRECKRGGTGGRGAAWNSSRKRPCALGNRRSAARRRGAVRERGGHRTGPRVRSRALCIRLVQETNGVKCDLASQLSGSSMRSRD